MIIIVPKSRFILISLASVGIIHGTGIIVVGVVMSIDGVHIVVGVILVVEGSFVEIVDVICGCVVGGEVGFVEGYGGRVLVFLSEKFTGLVWTKFFNKFNPKKPVLIYPSPLPTLL